MKEFLRKMSELPKDKSGFIDNAKGKFSGGIPVPITESMIRFCLINRILKV